ncbi:MAG: CsbD family protein [Pseudomonadota bacterium]
MNEDKIKGQWKQLRGKLKARWGKLTDDDLDVAEGSADYLAGKVQERYGIAKDEAEKQIKEFDKSMHEPAAEVGHRRVQG